MKTNEYIIITLEAAPHCNIHFVGLRDIQAAKDVVTETFGKLTGQDVPVWEQAKTELNSLMDELQVRFTFINGSNKKTLEDQYNTLKNGILTAILDAPIDKTKRKFLAAFDEWKSINRQQETVGNLS